MKEAVNEEHEGKRKCELTWKVHRIHWEKNRFIYDLMYKRKVMSRELVGCFVTYQIAEFGWSWKTSSDFWDGSKGPQSAHK